MRQLRISAALSAAVLVAQVASAGTGQVVLDAVKDNTLLEDSFGSFSNGAGTFFIAGRAAPMSGALLKRALIDFDIAGGVPAGSTITGVTLTLNMRKSIAGTEPVTMYRVMADWGEGGSIGFGGAGAAATPGDATWLDRINPTDPWTTPGGDYSTVVTATTMVGGNGAYTWSSAKLVGDVQGMLDNPVNDHGWVLIGNESTPTTTKLFSSREYNVASERPKLTIDFIPPPAAAYCTAGTSASGCQAAIAAVGTASASASSGFVVSVSTVEGQKDGMFFYGTSGRQANPWGSGTSFNCVQSPRLRGGLLAAAGTNGACDGSFSQDLNARWCAACPKPSHNPGSGTLLQTQFWYRDPMNTSNQTTSLSNAIEVYVCP